MTPGRTEQPEPKGEKSGQKRKKKRLIDHAFALTPREDLPPRNTLSLIYDLAGYTSSGDPIFSYFLADRPPNFGRPPLTFTLATSFRTPGSRPRPRPILSSRTPAPSYRPRSKSTTHPVFPGRPGPAPGPPLNHHPTPHPRHRHLQHPIRPLPLPDALHKHRLSRPNPRHPRLRHVPLLRPLGDPPWRRARLLPPRAPEHLSYYQGGEGRAE